MSTQIKQVITACGKTDGTCPESGWDVVVTGKRSLEVSLPDSISPEALQVSLPGVQYTPGTGVSAAQKQEQEQEQEQPDPLKEKAKKILCSDTTGNVADAVIGTLTGIGTGAAIKGANWAYAASVGGRIGSVVGGRAALIAGGPAFLISAGVALGTSAAVRYARSQFCPAGA
jgi:hypothetical protein